MDAIHFENLQELCTNCSDWKGSLFFPINYQKKEVDEIIKENEERKFDPDCYDSDEHVCEYKILETTDICPLLLPSSGHVAVLRKHHGFPPSSRFRFHSRFDGPDGKEVLVAELKRCARLSGFELSTKKKREKPLGHRLISVNLGCHYSVTYRGKPKPFTDDNVTQDGVKTQGVKDNNHIQHHSQYNKRSTKRPIDCNRKCQFGLLIFLHKDQHWYLSTQKSENSVHRHHFQQDPDQMPTRLQHLSKQELELLNQCSSVLISPTDASNLLNKMPGKCRISPSQVRYLRTKQLASHLSADASTATRLIDSLKLR